VSQIRALRNPAPKPGGYQSSVSARAPSPGDPPAPAANPRRDLEELQRQIREILLLLKWHETQQFRSLCRLALDWDVDPEGFRLLLTGAGLRKQRASEIKAVPAHPEACRDFLAGTPWRQALRLAQRPRLSPLELAARDLVRRLAVVGEQWPEGQTHQGWLLERDSAEQVRLTHPYHGVLELLRTDFALPPDPE
jgi:hypothetical protein